MQTCPFTSNTVSISGPNRSVKVTDRSTCILTNVIYCITCTLCNKIYIGETGRKLADRFREHLRDVEKNNTDASKPAARHSVFLITPTTTGVLAGYTTGTQKAAKISSKNSFFNWVHSPHTELMNASHSTNLFANSCDHISTNGKAPLHSHINNNTPQFPYPL